MNIEIKASELRKFGVDPSRWSTMDNGTRKRVASTILHRRGNKVANEQAFLLETNNPNAVTGLSLVWDSPQ